jgi:hypothetical protein
MPEPFRLSLTAKLSPRDSTSEKDSLSANVFYEKDSKGTVRAVKRPGLVSYLEASGAASGIFYYDGQLFSFTNASPTPVIT